MRYAVVSPAGLVANVITWDGQTPFDPGDGAQMVEAPEAVGPGWTYDGETFAPPEAVETPPVPAAADTISRLDFRRLLLPAEAARFRLLEAAPRLTAAELEAAFDPEGSTPELQLRVAVEDCIQQWNFLDQGVLELDHADTAEFLAVMGYAGMFGADAATRVPQILARQPPG